MCDVSFCLKGNLYLSKASDLKAGKRSGLATEKLWLVYLDDDAFALVFSLQCSWEEVHKRLCKTKASHRGLKGTQHKNKLWCDTKEIFHTVYFHQVKGIWCELTWSPVSQDLIDKHDPALRHKPIIQLKLWTSICSQLHYDTTCSYKLVH